MTERSATARREGVTAVHSLDHFVFSVPDLDEAARFYDDFGLDVRRRDDRLHLHTVRATRIAGGLSCARPATSGSNTSRSARLPRISTR